MNIIKMRFSTAVHFGNGYLSDSSISIPSDTLFSALFTECLKLGIPTDFLFELKISDLFPYCENEYYLPKPIMTIENKADPSLRKEFKKLRYIPLSRFNDFVTGKTLPTELYCEFGQPDQKVRLNKCVEGDPYYVGDFTFYGHTGLYFLTNSTQINPVLESLSLTGIGGKRSSGLGRFEFSVERADIFDMLLSKATVKKMTLSSAMTDNLTDDILRNATYLLQKRSGFVYSGNYSDTNVKKNDFYTFMSGSVFENTFDGGIFDVSNHGNHKVYRYAKPMWVGVI
jgi:CRISPR-associated protein Csm4